MKISEKTAEKLFLIFLSILVTAVFFLGYFWGKEETKNSYPVLQTVKLIEKYYVNKPSPKTIKYYQYVAIETMIGHLDPYSHFFRPSSTNANICRPEPVEFKIINETIGYIKIPSFRQGETYAQVKAIISSFERKNIKGLLLDLRDNPGGVAKETIKTAGLFLEQGKTIITFKFRPGDPETIYKTKDKILFDKPVVILINGKTASAAEIFSGALHDNKRAILVGTKTFGKGCGQKVFLFYDGSVLSLTAFKFYLPNGFYPQGLGILPDITVEDPDLQFQKAIEILKTAQ